MTRLALLTALCLAFALPARAQMTPALCDEGWARFSDAIGLSSSGGRAKQDVTPEGWCRVKSGAGGILSSDFKELRWKATDLRLALARGVMPETLMAEIDGVDVLKSFHLTAAPGLASVQGDIRLSLTQDPATRELKLDHLGIFLGALGEISVIGRASGVDLSSPAAMQLSAGALRLHSLRLDVAARGLVPRLIMPSVMANQPDGRSRAETLALFSAQVADILDAMPPRTLPARDRAEITALLRSLPQTRGRFALNLTSETGFGVTQLSLGALAVKKAQTKGEPLAPALAHLFNGITLEAAWTPGF